MPDNSVNTKRIAKNTLMLYFRMIVVILVNLYTSRVILSVLGIDDYGIYNVVGGVVLFFSFFNSCMSTSTQRFLNIAIGKGDEEQLKKVFSTSLLIHILIGLFVVICAETIGLWFVNNKLVIPQERMFAANCVYQISIVSFFVNIMQVPYNASIIAHERMSVFAYITIIDVFLKLLIVYLLTYISYDKLIVYGILHLSVIIFIRQLYQIYCRRHFSECHFSFCKDKRLFKEMSQFAGWNMFGSVAWLLRGQGQNILLNMFFGPAINAAKAICSQVQHAVMGFVSNFQTAMNPQITQTYAQNKIEEMESLVYRSLKFSFIILFMFALPIILNIDFILDFWLESVPDYTNVFVILSFCDALVGNLFGVPLMTALSATGKIRNYQIVVSSIILMYIPICYFVLRTGFYAPSVLYVSIGISFFSGVIRFLYCRRQIGFSLKKILKLNIYPLLLMVLLVVPLSYYLRVYVYNEQTWFDFILLSVITILEITIISWFVCIRKGERIFIISMLKSILHRK